MWKRNLLMAVAAVLLAGLACKDNTNTNRATPGAATDPASTATSDARITSDVHKAITDTADLSAGAKSATVATDKGVVTLRGTVVSAAEKDRVGALAKGVAGVTRVDNQLEVKTP